MLDETVVHGPLLHYKNTSRLSRGDDVRIRKLSFFYTYYNFFRHLTDNQPMKRMDSDSPKQHTNCLCTACRKNDNEQNDNDQNDYDQNDNDQNDNDQNDNDQNDNGIWLGFHMSFLSDPYSGPTMKCVCPVHPPTRVHDT